MSLQTRMSFLMILVMGRIRIVAILLFLCNILVAQDFPPRPSGNERFVQDYADIMDGHMESYLIRKIRHQFDTTSNEIVIVTEKTTGKYTIQQYSLKLAKEWGIGREGKNNGVLIYVASEDRKVFIQVGKGLEGAIPDVYASRIIRNVIEPNFKQGKFGKGLNEATDIIIGLAAGEFVFDEEMPKGNGPPIWLIVAIVILVFYLASRGGNNGYTYDQDPSSRRARRTGGHTPWIGGGGGGGWTGGGGGFGGGFGGGSFGGGGAGGSW